MLPGEAARALDLPSYHSPCGTCLRGSTYDHLFRCGILAKKGLVINFYDFTVRHLQVGPRDTHNSHTVFPRTTWGQVVLIIHALQCWGSFKAYHNFSFGLQPGSCNHSPWRHQSLLGARRYAGIVVLGIRCRFAQCRFHHICLTSLTGIWRCSIHITQCLTATKAKGAHHRATTQPRLSSTAPTPMSPPPARELSKCNHATL